MILDFNAAALLLRDGPQHNDTVRTDGPARLDQPRIYYGPVIANTLADYAIVGRNGVDREYDYETNTETKNYTYTGAGGVDIGNWLARAARRVGLMS